jgi:hypothetical protein
MQPQKLPLQASVTNQSTPNFFLQVAHTEETTTENILPDASYCQRAFNLTQQTEQIFPYHHTPQYSRTESVRSHNTSGSYQSRQSKYIQQPTQSLQQTSTQLTPETNTQQQIIEEAPEETNINNDKSHAQINAFKKKLIIQRQIKESQQTLNNLHNVAAEYSKLLPDFLQYTLNNQGKFHTIDENDSRLKEQAELFENSLNEVTRVLDSPLSTLKDRISYHTNMYKAIQIYIKYYQAFGIEKTELIKIHASFVLSGIVWGLNLAKSPPLYGIKSLAIIVALQINSTFLSNTLGSILDMVCGSIGNLHICKGAPRLHPSIFKVQEMDVLAKTLQDAFEKLTQKDDFSQLIPPNPKDYPTNMSSEAYLKYLIQIIEENSTESLEFKEFIQKLPHDNPEKYQQYLATRQNFIHALQEAMKNMASIYHARNKLNALLCWYAYGSGGLIRASGLIAGIVAIAALSAKFNLNAWQNACTALAYIGIGITTSIFDRLNQHIMMVLINLHFYCIGILNIQQLADTWQSKEELVFTQVKENTNYCRITQHYENKNNVEKLKACFNNFNAHDGIETHENLINTTNTLSKTQKISLLSVGQKLPYYCSFGLVDLNNLARKQIKKTLKQITYETAGYEAYNDFINLDWHKLNKQDSSIVQDIISPWHRFIHNVQTHLGSNFKLDEQIIKNFSNTFFLSTPAPVSILGDVLRTVFEKQAWAKYTGLGFKALGSIMKLLGNIHSSSLRPLVQKKINTDLACNKLSEAEKIILTQDCTIGIEHKVDIRSKNSIYYALQSTHPILERIKRIADMSWFCIKSPFTGQAPFLQRSIVESRLNRLSKRIEIDLKFLFNPNPNPKQEDAQDSEGTATEDRTHQNTTENNQFSGEEGWKRVQKNNKKELEKRIASLIKPKSEEDFLENMHDFLNDIIHPSFLNDANYFLNLNGNNPAGV